MPIADTAINFAASPLLQVDILQDFPPQILYHPAARPVHHTCRDFTTLPTYFSVVTVNTTFNIQ